MLTTCCRHWTTAPTSLTHRLPGGHRARPRRWQCASHKGARLPSARGCGPTLDGQRGGYGLADLRTLAWGLQTPGKRPNKPHPPPAMRTNSSSSPVAAFPTRTKAPWRARMRCTGASPTSELFPVRAVKLRMPLPTVQLPAATVLFTRAPPDVIVYVLHMHAMRAAQGNVAHPSAILLRNCGA